MSRVTSPACWMLVMIASLSACNKSEPAAAEKSARGGARGGVAAVFAVDVIPVEKRKVEYLVSGPGSLDAFEEVQVTARVAGVVDKVAFKEGQQVKKGDVLAVIQAERFQLAVNSAKAALAKTQAAEKDNEAMVERRQGASEKFPGLIPGEELATYQTKQLTAHADTAVALENLRIAQLNLRDANVRAPMAGVIQTRTVQTGQYVQTGYVMATLLQNDPMLLRFPVSPQDAPRIKVGMVVDFKLRESQTVYHAKVSLVAAAADDASRMVSVTAQVDDEGRKYWLRPGSFADVTVRVGAQRDAPMVPRAAVRPSERGLLVYVVKPAEVAATGEGVAPGAGGDKARGGRGGEGKPGAGAPGGAQGGPMMVAEERLVTLGMTTKDGWVEIRTGLEGGEQLVVRGGESLSNGAKVRPNVVQMPAPGEGDAKETKTPEGMPSARPDPRSEWDGGAP